jgi:hypothetical protein
MSILNQRLILVVAASAARCASGRVARDIAARELARARRNVAGVGTAGDDVVQNQKNEGDDACGLQVPRALALIHPGVLDFLAHGFGFDALVFERRVARVARVRGFTFGENDRGAPATWRGEGNVLPGGWALLEVGGAVGHVLDTLASRWDGGLCTLYARCRELS